MLTAAEQAELAALESEFALPTNKTQREPLAPVRSPGDLSYNIQVLSPDEEAELMALEDEFSQRPGPGPADDRGVVTQVLEGIDSYTGAPVRKAIGTFQDTNSLSQAGGALIDQFGAEPGLAPTGKEIATKLGFSDSVGEYKTNPKTGMTNQRTVSDAGVVGVAIDATADLTNLLPFAGTALKGAVKGTKSFLSGSARAADAVLGTPLVKVGDVALDSGKAAKESIKNARVSFSKMFKPDIAPDFNELSEIAAKNGIDKSLLNEAVEFGENSVISRHARNVAEGPMGNLEKHDQLVQAVSQATENTITRIGKTASIADDVEAGTIIREAYDEGVDRFFNQMGETYSNAVKLNPGMRLDKKSTTILNSNLNKMGEWARKRLGETGEMEKVLNNPGATKGQVKNATSDMLNVLDSTNKAITKTQKAQAKEVVNAVGLIKNAMTTSGGDLGQVYSAMRDIGEIAFKSKASLAEVPSDIRKFQELYFSLQKGMTESIRSGLGDDFADALVKNNSEMSNFFTKRGQLSNIIGNKDLANEKVFNSLIMNGDSKKIDALMSIISPEAAGQLKASFLNKTLSRNADGVISFASSRKKLNGLKSSGKLKNLFSVDELKEIDDILKLGDRSGIGVLSTSGTGASGKFQDLVGTFKDKLAGDTLIDNLKNSARSNYVETSAKSSNGVEYAKKIKAPEVAKSKSGLQLLRDGSPVTKKQTIQAGKVNTIDNRNERLEQYKKMRGL
jgi:hypothetical protein